MGAVAGTLTPSVSTTFSFSPLKLNKTQPHIGSASSDIDELLLSPIASPVVQKHRATNITLGTQSSSSTPKSSVHQIGGSSSNKLGHSSSDLNDAPGTGRTPRLEPVVPSLLDVPHLERHPFQDYRYSKKLGEGSFSAVYKASVMQDDTRKVAIKEIEVKKLNKQQLTELNVEMNILSQLHHPNIVSLIGVYSLAEKKFMVMEYLRGGDLLNAVCRRDFYTEGDARRIMREITAALQYMHERKVIHRDVKPENLILSEKALDSPVKIVDFGFATIETDSLKKGSRYLCGTPGYMAPEVIRDRAYSTKTDIWSLGVVLYILLSGLMPFSTDQQDTKLVLIGDYTFPEVRFNTVSGAAKDLITKMLVVNPDQRYSAKDVLEHPWMRLPVFCAPPNSNDCSSCSVNGANSINEEYLNDVDISGNLEALRQHNAMRRFNLSALVRSGFSSIGKGLSGKGSASQKADYRRDRRASAPAIVLKENAQDAKQQEKLARLSAAIAAHNHAVVTQREKELSIETSPSLTHASSSKKQLSTNPLPQVQEESERDAKDKEQQQAQGRRYSTGYVPKELNREEKELLEKRLRDEHLMQQVQAQVTEKGKSRMNQRRHSTR